MTVYRKLINSIGPFKALKVCRELGISIYTLIDNLSVNKSDLLTKIITPKGSVVKSNIQRLIKVGSYRGSRHKLGYPTRGQRTRSNAKTSKFLNKPN